MTDINAKDVSIYGISKEGELDSFSILHMSANLCEVTCEENADYYNYQSIKIKTNSEKKYTFKIKQAGCKDWSVYDTVCIFFISKKNMCMLICKNISQEFNELTKELILFCTNPTMVMFDESYGHNSEFIMVEYLRKYYPHPIYRGRELIRFPDIEMEEEKSKVSLEIEKMKERRNHVHIIDIDGLNKYLFARIRDVDTNLDLGYVQVPIELADKLTVNTKFTINSTILYDSSYLQKGLYPIVSVPGQEPGKSLNGTVCQVTSIQEVPPTYEDVIKLMTFYASWHILNDITVIEEKKEKPILADERFYFIEVIIHTNGDWEKKHQLFEVPYHKYFELIRGQTLMINDTERYYTNDGERHWLKRVSNYNPHFGYDIVNKYDFDTLKDAYKKIKEINGEDIFEGINYSFWHYILKYTLYEDDKIIKTYDFMEDKWETMVRNTPVTSSASIEINKESSERERVETQAFKKRFEELRDRVENSRRKNSMNNIFKNINIQFGEIKTDQIKYSFNGIAFKNADGTYSTYDINTNTLTNVSDLIMDIPMYVMPAAIKDIKTGDIVIHKGIVYVIKEIVNDNFTAIQPNTGTMTTLIPEKSIFGYSYCTKVMNIMETFKANEDNPFGNMLPFLMMNKESNNDTLALMMMIQGNQDLNKILPFMLMGKENIDPIAMMLLMNFNK